jgi:hypothetical protein
MKKTITLGLIIASTIGLTCCKKNNTGGNAMVTAYVYHHDKPINIPTVYVKFGTKDLPNDPTNNYDLKLTASHENHVHIKNLRYGNYYIYAVGFDSTIMQTVTGGFPVTIKWKERRNEKDVNVPVTE